MREHHHGLGLVGKNSTPPVPGAMVFSDYYIFTLEASSESQLANQSDSRASPLRYGGVGCWVPPPQATLRRRMDGSHDCPLVRLDSHPIEAILDAGSEAAG